MDFHGIDFHDSKKEMVPMVAKLLLSVLLQSSERVWDLAWPSFLLAAIALIGAALAPLSISVSVFRVDESDLCGSPQKKRPMINGSKNASEMFLDGCLKGPDKK